MNQPKTHANRSSASSSGVSSRASNRMVTINKPSSSSSTTPTKQSNVNTNALIVRVLIGTKALNEFSGVYLRFSLKQNVLSRYDLIIDQVHTNKNVITIPFNYNSSTAPLLTITAFQNRFLRKSKYIGEHEMDLSDVVQSKEGVSKHLSHWVNKRKNKNISKFLVSFNVRYQDNSISSETSSGSTSALEASSRKRSSDQLLKSNLLPPIRTRPQSEPEPLKQPLPIPSVDLSQFESEHYTQVDLTGDDEYDDLVLDKKPIKSMEKKPLAASSTKGSPPVMEKGKAPTSFKHRSDVKIEMMEPESDSIVSTAKSSDSVSETRAAVDVKKYQLPSKPVLPPKSSTESKNEDPIASILDSRSKRPQLPPTTGRVSESKSKSDIEQLEPYLKFSSTETRRTASEDHNVKSSFAALAKEAATVVNKEKPVSQKQPALLVQDLPDQLLLQIFTFLPAQQFASIGRVNTKWLAFTKDSSNWLNREKEEISNLLMSILKKPLYVMDCTLVDTPTTLTSANTPVDPTALKNLMNGRKSNQLFIPQNRQEIAIRFAYSSVFLSGVKFDTANMKDCFLQIHTGNSKHETIEIESNNASMANDEIIPVYQSVVNGKKVKINIHSKSQVNSRGILLKSLRIYGVEEPIWKSLQQLAFHVVIPFFLKGSIDLYTWNMLSLLLTFSSDHLQSYDERIMNRLEEMLILTLKSKSKISTLPPTHSATKLTNVLQMMLLLYKHNEEFNKQNNKIIQLLNQHLSIDCKHNYTAKEFELILMIIEAMKRSMNNETISLLKKMSKMQSTNDAIIARISAIMKSTCERIIVKSLNSEDKQQLTWNEIEKLKLSEPELFSFGIIEKIITKSTSSDDQAPVEQLFKSILERSSNRFELLRTTIHLAIEKNMENQLTQLLLSLIATTPVLLIDPLIRLVKEMIVTDEDESKPFCQMLIQVLGGAGASKSSQRSNDNPILRLLLTMFYQVEQLLDGISDIDFKTTKKRLLYSITSSIISSILSRSNSHLHINNVNSSDFNSNNTNELLLKFLIITSRMEVYSDLRDQQLMNFIKKQENAGWLIETLVFTVFQLQNKVNEQKERIDQLTQPPQHHEKHHN